VPKLNKTDHGQLVTTEIIASLHNASRLERVLSAEIRLLKELAIKIIAIEMQEIAKIEIA
jgi:hypothetical protein